MTQAYVCQVLALVHTHRAEPAAAERLAREAVAQTERTDSLRMQAEALCDLAQVLAAAERFDEAEAALEQALDRCRRREPRARPPGPRAARGAARSARVRVNLLKAGGESSRSSITTASCSTSRRSRVRPPRGHRCRPDYGSSVDRSGGSGAGVLPDLLPTVGGTGGEGGGCRVRAARTINAVLPPTTSTPPTSNPIATQSRKDSLAPRSMSAATPREPSAFIRTTDQSPSRTFHVTVCVPTPEAEAAQKRCSVGGPCGAPPVTGRYVTRKGSNSMSSTLAWATLPGTWRHPPPARCR